MVRTDERGIEDKRKVGREGDRGREESGRHGGDNK